MRIRSVAQKGFTANIQQKFLPFVRKSPVFSRGQEREAAAWIFQNNPGNYSIGYLIEQLWLARKIPHEARTAFTFATSNYKEYQATTWLHSMPEDVKPLPMLQWLADSRPPENKFSMAVLAAMLWAGGRIPGNKKQNIIMLAGSYDLYEQILWLYKAPILKSAEEAAKYLIEQQGADRKLSLSYLMQCLWIGGKIPPDRLQDFQMKAGAADYALRFKGIISREFVRAFKQLESFSERRFRKMINRRIFVAQDGSGKILSRAHTNRIIVMAMELYGRDLLADLAAGEEPDMPDIEKNIIVQKSSPAQRQAWAASFPLLTEPFDIAIWINEHPLEGCSRKQALAELVYFGKVAQAQGRAISSIQVCFDLLAEHSFLKQAPFFEEPLELLSWLKGKQPEGIKMTALTVAMILAGKISKDKYVQLQWLATAFNRLTEFPWVMAAPKFNNIRDLLVWIENEPEVKTFPHSLGFLGSMLLAAGRIKSNRYSYFLGAYEFAKEQIWLRDAPEFDDYEKMKTWINAQKQSVLFRKVVSGLYALEKVPYTFVSRGFAEYYIEMLPWLKDAPVFEDSRTMFDWLKHKLEERNVALKPSSLLFALQLLGKISFSDYYSASVSACQFIEDDPWIKSVPAFKDVNSGLKWLSHNMPQNKHYGCVTFINAMIIEGKMPAYSHTWAVAYVIKNKEIILRELSSMKLSDPADLSRIEQIRNTFPRDVLMGKRSKTILSKSYFYQVIACAIMIYGDEVKIEIPRAKQMAVYALILAIVTSPGLDYLKKRQDLKDLLLQKEPEERRLICDMIRQGAIGKFGWHIGHFGKFNEMLPEILNEISTT